jgi:hypothetical protein
MTAQESAPPQATPTDLASQLVGVSRALLAQHKPDPRGDCTACSMEQGGKVKFPCTLHALGGIAEKLPSARAANT